MTRKQYITELLKTYSMVSVLSTKNECEVLRVRNAKQDKDMVIRSLPAKNAAYEELYHVNCENLPLIYDVIDTDDGQVILEEYIEGITVAEVMETGRYRYWGARKVICAVCNALSVLHQLNLVHRDVKPENIIVDRNGKVVLIDFHVSRKMSANTKDTVVMGTVGYVSPEQLGIAQSDARTDIYAVGVMLNVMMIGKHPSEKMAKGYIGHIVRKCTAISPDDRYQTVKQLKRALQF